MHAYSVPERFTPRSMRCCPRPSRRRLPATCRPCWAAALFARIAPAPLAMSAAINAISEAIARYRAGEGIDGPLYLGRDTHALSEPAFRTAVEVLAAHGIDVVIDSEDSYTPTPAISREILKQNENGAAKADGIVITPSHNPPEDGGFKYNPPTGGPADTGVTRTIQDTANELLRAGPRGVQPRSHEQA